MLIKISVVTLFQEVMGIGHGAVASTSTAPTPPPPPPALPHTPSTGSVPFASVPISQWSAPPSLAAALVRSSSALIQISLKFMAYCKHICLRLRATPDAAEVSETRGRRVHSQCRVSKPTLISLALLWPADSLPHLAVLIAVQAIKVA